MSESKRIHFSKEILLQKIDNQAIILNLKDECYYGFDDVATAMWELLSTHQDSQKIIDCLMEQYNVDRATLENDLANFINELIDMGFVTLEPSE